MAGLPHSVVGRGDGGGGSEPRRPDVPPLLQRRARREVQDVPQQRQVLHEESAGRHGRFRGHLRGLKNIFVFANSWA